MSRPAFGHTGFTGTSLWIAPQHDLYVMLLTNRVNPTREHSKIGPVRVVVADLAMRALAPEAASSSLTSRP
jgi:CubicO group peptidase (beta-lactamase class C family)